MRTNWILWILLILAIDPQMAFAEVQMQEKFSYGGWPNCVRLTNGQIVVVITTDVGPRVIRLGFVGGQNLFKEFAEDMGKTGGHEWRSYGGHRLEENEASLDQNLLPLVRQTDKYKP